MEAASLNGDSESSEIVKSDCENSRSSSRVEDETAKPVAAARQATSGRVGPTAVTRIGRPCNNVPKPAVPRQNNPGFGGGENMSSASSVRKISHELERKRISDVYSSTEITPSPFGNGKWSGDRKSSSGSILSDSGRKSSSDDLRRKKSSDGSISLDSSDDRWKFDHEPRRPSDVSVVLTQDTDSFIIGDRVWVGGTKAGHIAYIGETQFAPGEWAGVVLDEPIGKNDGSVANIRYFQCEPKKGIFSRLTRLTRYPIPEANSSEPAAPNTLPLETRKISESLGSVPKRSSVIYSPTTPTSRNMFSKSSSPDSAIHPNISVGDRVIIMSSQGSKAGILRFLGATDFAPGEWCGVELDDPLGKNDGSVAGTRYFECRPKFGLFAPLHKVSKSPASRRPSQASCQIHRGGGTVGIRRQGSKESLASMSSIASTATSMRSSTRKIGVRTPTTPTSTKNALQEILKEKEIHIEQLLKERDLERSEITRAANQADEAEKRLAMVQQEFEQRKEELEARIADLDAMVCLLKAENEELSGNLEEERKKNEDLLFRFEEEFIEKGDLTLLVQSLKSKADELEKSLVDEKKKIELLELDSNKLFEAEEQLVALKEENHALREAVDEQKKIRCSANQEHIGLEATILALRAELDSVREEARIAKTSASEEKQTLQESLLEARKALEIAKADLSTKQEQLEQMQMEAKEKNDILEKNIKELSVIRESEEKREAEELRLRDELAHLKAESDLKLESLMNEMITKSSMCNDLETQILELNVKLSKIMEQKSSEELKNKETEERLQKELLESRESVKEKISQLESEMKNTEIYRKDVEELKKSLKKAEDTSLALSESHEKEIVALKQIITQQQSELNLVKNEAKNFADESNKLKEALSSGSLDFAKKLKELEDALKIKESQLENLAIESESFKKKAEMRYNELERDFKSKESELQLRINQLEGKEVEKEKEIASLRKELEEKCTLIDEKEKMLLNLNRQFQTAQGKLATALNVKEELERERSCLLETFTTSKLSEGSTQQEMELGFLAKEISNKVAALKQAEETHIKALEAKEMELNKTKSEFTERENEMRRELQSLKLEIQKVNADSKATENDLRAEIENCSKETNTKIMKYQEEIARLEKAKRETNNAKEKLVKSLEKNREEVEERLKMSQLELADARKEIDDLQKKNFELLKSLEDFKSEALKSKNEMAEANQTKIAHLEVKNEKIQNELKDSDEKLKSALQEIADIKEEKVRAEEEKVRLAIKVSSIEKSFIESQTRNSELEAILLSCQNNIKSLEEDVNQKKEETERMGKEVAQKMKIINEMKDQLKVAEEQCKKSERECHAKTQMIESLEQKLKMANDSRSKQMAENEKVVETLKSEVEHLKEDLLKMELSKKESIAGSKEEITRLKSEMEARGTEIDSKRAEIEDTKKILIALEKDLADEKRKNEEKETLMFDMQEKYAELTNKMEEKKMAMENRNELNARIKLLTEKAEEAEKTREEMKVELQEKETLTKTLENSQTLLKEKEVIISNLYKQVETLKKEMDLMNSNKAVVETLEKEKKQLQSRLDNIESNRKEKGTAVDDENIEEGREFTQGQVDFLNSVIVDMQKKNEALKARIEILEMGFSPEDVEDFSLENFSRKTVAPRLFCDICDVFDLHDTEDCPTQAMDQDDVPVRRVHPKVLPPERPYCEICEVFGHDTADCNDAQTF